MSTTSAGFDLTANDPEDRPRRPAVAFQPGVRDRLAEQGIELTPAQLAAERQKIYETICHAMSAKGHTPPASYQEMIEFLRKHPPKGGG